MKIKNRLLSMTSLKKKIESLIKKNFKLISAQKELSKLHNCIIKLN